MLKEGNIITNFTIPTDDGNFSLELNGKQKTVIFFFPRADTSGCTKEALEFSSLKDEFIKLNTQLIGISKDTPGKQRKFRLKFNLTCALGADFETKICEYFSVWVEKSMYGKKYMGIKRTTFLIDEVGKVLKIWDKVKVPYHAEEVLKAIKNI